MSYEAIRLWCIQFGSEYARRLKRRQGRLGDTWHLDEVFVTILPPRCNVVPASATYGRLMPRGAGFCYVFTALSSSDSRHFHRLPRSGVRCQAVSICTGSCTRITRAASRNQRCLGFRWRMAKFEPRSDNKCSLSASRCRGADGRTGTAAAAEVGLRFFRMGARSGASRPWLGVECSWVATTEGRRSVSLRRWFDARTGRAGQAHLPRRPPTDVSEARGTRRTRTGKQARWRRRGRKNCPGRDARDGHIPRQVYERPRASSRVSGALTGATAQLTRRPRRVGSAARPSQAAIPSTVPGRIS